MQKWMLDVIFLINQQRKHTYFLKTTCIFLLTGPDAESIPVQVLVHGCHLLRGLYPNGCCRGRNEQRKSDLAAEMEHEPAHHRVLGKLNSQICCIYS